MPDKGNIIEAPEALCGELKAPFGFVGSRWFMALYPIA
jgi:hypothetical protein